MRGRYPAVSYSILLASVTSVDASDIVPFDQTYNERGEKKGSDDLSAVSSVGCGHKDYG